MNGLGRRTQTQTYLERFFRNSGQVAMYERVQYIMDRARYVQCDAKYRREKQGQWIALSRELRNGEEDKKEEMDQCCICN